MTDVIVRIQKRALHAAPFFVGLVWLLWPGAVHAECRASQADEQVRVARVFDGDTVLLADGRKLRLIGINTPEQARDRKPAEAYADAATAALQDQQQGSPLWWLIYDAERRDRYGRLLAHVFDTQGESLTARLLRQGTGQLLVVPPNLKFLDCYRLAQHEAQAARRGLWALPEYQVLTPAGVASVGGGYRMVRGKITRVGLSRSAWWLNMGQDFAVRIKKEDLQYFRDMDLQAWTGREITVQGWLYARNGQWRMRVRHPAALGWTSP